MPDSSFDAIIPPNMAAKAEEIGVKKVGLPALNMFVLAVLAGAFISMGAIIMTTVTAGSMSTTGIAEATVSTSLPYGITRLIGGLVFTVGLVLVVVGGAELFTGNSLILMAFMSKKVKLMGLLRNWVIVYFGNFLGAVATATIAFLSGQYKFPVSGGVVKGAIGLNMLNIADFKCSLNWHEALFLGILCNALVCMAVWLTYSTRTTTDKILAIVPPITAFAAAGFEHSIANMYFIPVALMVKAWGSSEFFTAIGKTAADFKYLTVKNFLVGNLLPVTIGNIIGGAVLVGLVYWLIYLRKKA